MSQPKPALISIRAINTDSLPTRSRDILDEDGARHVIFEDELLAGHGSDLCSIVRGMETRMRRRNDWYGGDR